MKGLIVIVCYLSLFYTCANWCLKTQISDSEKINSVDFSPDGSKIVTASDSNRVIVWDAFTMEQLHVYDVGMDANSAKFSKDGQLIVMGFDHDNLHLINASDYSVIATNLDTDQGQVLEVDFSWDHQFLVACGNGQTTTLFRKSGSSFTKIDDDQDAKQPVTSCRFSKTDNQVASVDLEGDLYTTPYSSSGFGSRNRQRIGSVFYETDWKDTTQQVLAVGTDKKLFFANKNLNNDYSLTFTVEIYTLTVSEDGSYAVVGGQNGAIGIFNIDSRNNEFLESTITVSPHDLTASAMSYNSQYLAVGNDQGTVFLYKRICEGCPSGSYTNGTLCRNCNLDMKGCYICTNSTNCLACLAGFYLSSTNTCEPCADLVDGCLMCSSPTVCLLCQNGFYLDTSDDSCQTCYSSMTGCLMCDSSAVCTLCDLKFYLNGTSNMCHTCANLTNCLSCNSSTNCIDCVQGYYQDLAGGCLRCPDNCTNCINGTFCTQCVDSLFLTALGACTPCATPHCLSCNTTGFCFDCIETTFVTGAGVCQFCDPPCLECSGAATTCDTCVSGYYIDSTTCKLCSDAITGCIMCLGSSATDCLGCATGFYLDNSGSCQKCDILLPGCNECTSTECLSCQLGYHYDSGSVQCIQCSVGCLSCTSPADCLSCEVGYFHASPANTCTRCPQPCSSCTSPTVCTSCNPMFYHNSTNQNCTQCSISQCTLCLSENVCSSCSEGYFVDNAGSLCRVCSTNITNCLECYDETNCKMCEVGFHLDPTNSSCLSCPFGCLTCDGTDCFTCELGWYWDSSATPKVCEQCSEECLECVSASNCSSCKIGLYLDTAANTCHSCGTILTGCSVCIETQCLSCSHPQGYFLNATDSTCPTCSAHIPDCQECINETYCTSCSHGFLKSATNTSCTACSALVPNCEHCFESSKCQTCFIGFYVDLLDQCSTCLDGCSTCTDQTTCEICFRQYVLETSGICTLCEDHIGGCQMCHYNPGIECLNCINGYYLDTAVCTLCQSALEGCILCSDSNTCFECSAGFYLFTDSTCHSCSSSHKSCQLCHYDTGTSSIICSECEEAFYLDSVTQQCSDCSQEGCLSCTDISICTNCQSAYYLDTGSASCELCHTTLPSCTICLDSSICLQCESGFYLDTASNTCSPCSVIGCEICSQTNPNTQCVSCNRNYFLDTGNLCSLCDTSMSNCQTCTSSTNCFACAAGFHVDSPTPSNCVLCSDTHMGCTLCNLTDCHECDSGYLINSSTSQCQLCNSVIQGCRYCLSSTSCLDCEPGYFQDGLICTRCSAIDGCINCLSPTECLFCDYGYFLENDTCHLCNSTIENCVSCVSSSICISCHGDYEVVSGKCSIIRGEAYPNYENIALYTEYVSPTELKHTLLSIGDKIYQIEMNWTNEVQLFLLDQSYTEYTLTITRAQFGPRGFSIMFFTDNPLSSLIDFGQIGQMSLFNTQSRTLQAASGFDIQNHLKSKIGLSEEGFNSLFPSIHHTGDFYQKYQLSEPEFYKSVVENQTYIYHYFGYCVSCLMVLIFVLKNFYIMPHSRDKGEIISHVLCFKLMGVSMYPLYPQYLNYCSGFMLLDFPWLNEWFSTHLTVQSDYIPDSFKMFYLNLNFPSTYLFASLITACLFLFGYWLCNKYLQDDDTQQEALYSNDKMWTIWKQTLYSIFIVGMVAAGFQSLQGAWYNEMEEVSLNSLFYTIGSGVYICAILQLLYDFYDSPEKIPDRFYRFRIITKVTVLCLVHLNPLYVFMGMLFIDLGLLVVNFILTKSQKIDPKIWLTTHIILDLGLCLMMVESSSLIFLILSSICIVVAIALELYTQCSEYQQIEEIQNIKIDSKKVDGAIEQIVKFNEKDSDQLSDTLPKNFKNKVINNKDSNISEMALVPDEQTAIGWGNQTKHYFFNETKNDKFFFVQPQNQQEQPLDLFQTKNAFSSPVTKKRNVRNPRRKHSQKKEDSETISIEQQQENDQNHEPQQYFVAKFN